jgi:hypothetical protein
VVPTPNTPQKSNRRTTPKRWLTCAQVAAEKGVSVDTIRRGVARGDYEVERVGPRCLRIILPAQEPA